MHSIDAAIVTHSCGVEHECQGTAHIFNEHILSSLEPVLNLATCSTKPEVPCGKGHVCCITMRCTQLRNRF